MHLDAIFFLKADRDLPEGEREALEDEVTIRLVDEFGEVRTATLGIAPGAAESDRVQLQHGPRRATAKDVDLHAALKALVQAD